MLYEVITRPTRARRSSAVSAATWTPWADSTSRHMILQLQRNAADSIEMLTNGMIDGIWGYQGDGGYFSQAEITYYQTAAIMHAMADTMSVKYINASFSTTDRMILV